MHATHAGDSDLSFQAFITTNNTVFLFVAISVAYGMVGGCAAEASSRLKSYTCRQDFYLV
jgi:hypothetical protein